MEQLVSITKSIIRVCKLSRVDVSETLAAFIARSVRRTKRKGLCWCMCVKKNEFVKCS